MCNTYNNKCLDINEKRVYHGLPFNFTEVISMRNIVNTFELVPSDAIRKWCAAQLLACTELIEYGKKTGMGAPPPFGINKALLAKLTPHSHHLSSYVNFGMTGMSWDTLDQFRGKFKYRSGNKGAIQAVPLSEGGGIYASGVPSGILRVKDPRELESSIPISALVFSYTPDTKTWTVTVHQHYAKPRKAKNTL